MAGRMSIIKSAISNLEPLADWMSEPERGTMPSPSEVDGQSLSEWHYPTRAGVPVPHKRVATIR